MAQVPKPPEPLFCPSDRKHFTWPSTVALSLLPRFSSCEFERDMCMNRLWEPSGVKQNLVFFNPNATSVFSLICH